MDKLARETKLKNALDWIRKDFNKMIHLTNSTPIPDSEDHSAKAYLDRQIGKYLKGIQAAGGFCSQANTLMSGAFRLPALVNEKPKFANDPRPNWNTEGVGEEDTNWKLNVGGGWAVKHSMGGNVIRINQKSFWLFPKLTLRGVMVHEASHFSLDTDDICYSSFSRNETLKNLTSGYLNADNWRIFYQKMSEYFELHPL